MDGSPNAQAKALLQLCDTPITADLPSPAEILHGHPAQGTVLSRPSRKVNIRQTRQRLVELQEKQKEQFDRAHRCQRSMSPEGARMSPVLPEQASHRPHQMDNRYWWLRYSNVDDPTRSKAPTAESTEGIKLI